MRDLGARSFFLLAGVPAVLAIAVLTYVLYLRDVDSVKDDVQQTARAVSLSVDAEIVGAMKFLQAFVSSSEALEASDFETVRRKAVAALVASDVADGLAVTDATGQQLVNTFADDGDALPRTLHIDRIHQVFATGKPQVSDVLVGTVSRKHQVVIDVPVIRDGQVRYDSDIVLSSERFQTLLQSQRLPADWVVVVFDRNGTVVGRSQEHEKYVGQKVVRPLVERLQGDLEGTFEMSTLNGLPITGAYARSPVTGYGVAIGVPKQLLWARLRADLGWPALGIAAAMGASLLLGWRFGGVMQRRREAEHAALAEQQRLFDILETLPVYVVLLTHDGQVQFANRVFRENFGHLDESAEGNPLVAARQACRAIDSEAVPGTSGASNLIERIWNAPDGAVYSVTDQRVADVSGQPLILEMGVNVTRQKRAEGEQALKQQTEGLSGVLQLAAPSDFGRNVLLPWLDDFKREHPHIQLQLLLNDRHADLFRETVDVALRFGVPSDSTLVALPILPEHRRVACASPAYLERHGTPQTPAELSEYSALLYLRNGRPYNTWRFHRDDETVEVEVRGDYLSDDGEVARRWALAGHGIAYKAWLDVAEDVRAGRLVTLFDDWHGESVPFNLLCPHRVQVSERVKVLQAFLRQRCEALRR